MWVRDLEPPDVPALATIFFRAIREGATAYSEVERAAWAPECPSQEAWAKRLEGLETVVAEKEGRPVGFMSVRPRDAYLDLAFVLPEWRGKGVSDLLYVVLETRARALGQRQMHTHASRMARSFFTRLGWVQTAVDHARRGDQTLERFVMHKDLGRITLAA